MIQSEHIAFAYEQKKVIDAIIFELQKGDVCAIMGLNGSGKSTLLKLIAGLLAIQEGKLLIDNRPINEYSRKLLSQKIAYVPQQQDIVFDFSVYDIVMMGRNPYQSRWETESETDREIVHQVLQQCNLSHLKDRMLTQLSGGEKQRTLIARAMAQQAPIMLLDEPLSNLDIIHKYEIMDILANLNRTRQITTLIILHDFPFAKQYANKTLLLKEGQLYYFGATDTTLIPEIIRETFNLSENYLIDDCGNVFKRV